MGVPKFFRYISERYPCLSELAREQSIPDFDNLYLDMNGIIHNCSHPDDTNIHFHITEEQIFKEIFNYIDKLFFLIKPQKLFFMAVDGVAPRAKMNQQRGRRFRSAKEAEVLEHAASLRGEHREHERFDSNCITPGTEFMARLQEALRYFVKNKISTDPLWQNCRVILSGQETPGEGEHKIMDYIRYLKSQPDFNPNTRHCLYGLDADLIILGLCTHELHFVILREEVKFGRKKRASLEETRFFLLHLGLLREYLELEFDELRRHDENFDIANIIDDWVLMGFLVGNDFIPHLPCLHISSNALPLLYKTYIKIYPELGGNINVAGKLNLTRLERYFQALSEVEYDLFQEHYADLRYFNAKLSKNGVEEAFDFDVSEITGGQVDADLTDLIESTNEFFSLQGGSDDSDENDDVSTHIAAEFQQYKKNYYQTKLKVEMNSAAQLELTSSYIIALQWILDYYYRGVQSWDWYYPYHYAPFISDLRNFKDLKINFNLGTPFLPFQQLLAVLPAASRVLLPAAYRELMTSATSEVIHFYPEDFESDLNGKRHEWEAVVLIPFIDEQQLLVAMAKCERNLTDSERERNKHGPMFQYDYNSTSQGTVPGIYSLKTIYHVFCTELAIWSKEIAVPSKRTVCIELPNAARHVFFPGFPTMKHLKFDFELKNARVRVFDYASRSVNMILKPERRLGLDDVVNVAQKYLNQVVYIGWPHLIKSKVVSITCKEKAIDVEGIKDNDARIFTTEAKSIEEHLLSRMGIEFDNLSVLLHVRTHAGDTLEFGNQGRIHFNDAWNNAITTYPAQGIVSELETNITMKYQFKKVEQLFPVNSQIFFIGNPYYGSEGTVLDPMLVYDCGRVQVSIVVRPEPDFTETKLLQNELEKDYVNSFEAANVTGLNIKCLSRITGNLLVVPGARRKLPENVSKLNIGLQLKFPRQNEERIGYARRVNNQWLYSSKALEIIELYYEQFPEIINFLSVSNDRLEYCFEQDIFPHNVGEKRLENICAWLKAQEFMKAERIACGSRTVENETVEQALLIVADLKNQPVKTVKLQVKPHLLLKPNVTLPVVYKPKRQLRLFDRIVVVRTTYMVPIGAKGTVVGIYPVVDPNPVRLECVSVIDNFYEVLFDKRIPNCNDFFGIAEERVYKIPESALLVIFTQDKPPLSFTNERQLQKRPTNTNNTNNTNTMPETPGISAAAGITQFYAKVQQRYEAATQKPSSSNNADFWLPKAASTTAPPKPTQVSYKNNNASANVNSSSGSSDSNNTGNRRTYFNSSAGSSGSSSIFGSCNSSFNVQSGEASNSSSMSDGFSSNQSAKPSTMNRVQQQQGSPQKHPQLPCQQKVKVQAQPQIISILQKPTAPATSSTDSMQQQTLALKSLLRLNIDATSPLSEEQPMPRAVLGMPTTEPPKLPQPPLFWQKEAQQPVSSPVQLPISQEIPTAGPSTALATATIEQIMSVVAPATVAVSTMSPIDINEQQINATEQSVNQQQQQNVKPIVNKQAPTALPEEEEDDDEFYPNDKLLIPIRPMAHSPVTTTIAENTEVQKADNATAQAPKPTRKRRVPKIGARFDFGAY